MQTKTFPYSGHLILLLLILIKFFLHYNLIHPSYDLHRDEYLHLDQANHFAWGYISVPPFTSWVSGLIKLLGNSIFWVKFFPALFGALTMVLVWKIIEVFKGGLYAKILGVVCILFSVILRINILYQPNSFDILAWTAVFYFFIKYIQNYQPKWLYFAAISFAFGLLNKYNIAFLAIGMLPAILLSSHRIIFLRKEVYISIIIVILIISPNLYWQYSNGFPVLYHMKELSETQLVNFSKVDFLISQLLFFTAAIPVIFIGFIGLFYHEQLKPVRFMLLNFLITLVVFIFFNAKGYYAIGLYPVYIAIGAVFVEKLFRGKLLLYIRHVFLILPLVYLIMIYNLIFPVRPAEEIAGNSEAMKKMGLLRWEDGKDHQLPQDFSDMLGWEELAIKTRKAVASINQPGDYILLCDNYGQAGAINFYAGGLNARSFNADYLNWIDLSKEYRHVVRVVDFEDREEELEALKPYFETAYIFDSINNPLAREYKTSVLVFINSFIGINEIVEEEIKAEKAKIAGLKE